MNIVFTTHMSYFLKTIKYNTIQCITLTVTANKLIVIYVEILNQVNFF